MTEIKLVPRMRLFVASVLLMPDIIPMEETFDGNELVTMPYQHAPYALWAKTEQQAEATIITNANVPEGWDISVNLVDVTNQLAGIPQNMRETDFAKEPTIPDREM